jgi:regulator of sirC expression with transglutaminase-like and TPR domain
MDVVGRFGELMAAPRPPLDQALALVAAAGRPQVDPDALVAELDSLAASIEGDSAARICAELFSPDGSIGLGGDRDDYYDARNSQLDEVLARRRGMPITLAVIGIEVARRRGVELEGIGMPGHFLLGDRTTGQFFDAFDGGRRLGPDGAKALFHSLHGVDQPFESVYLASTPSTMIVLRVLNNLRGAHLRSGDRRGLAVALELQAALPGTSLPARRDLAGVLAADGRFLDAAAVHDALAADDPSAAVDHLAAAQRLRARLN